MLTPLVRANFYLTMFGLFKVPLIWACRPKILEISPEHVVIKLPLRRKSKNHLNSMYFGALAVGADVAGGYLAMYKAEAVGEKISLAFKGVTAEFLKRAEADVHFVCRDGKKIDGMLEKTIATGERINEPVEIIALCPSLHQDEVMARFSLILSLKKIG